MLIIQAKTKVRLHMDLLGLHRICWKIGFKDELSHGPLENPLRPRITKGTFKNTSSLQIIELKEVDGRVSWSILGVGGSMYED